MSTAPVTSSGGRLAPGWQARLARHLATGSIASNMDIHARLNPGQPKPSLAPRVMPLREAAVLIPILDRPDPSVILTVRSADMPAHAGQIAFPGGKVDAHDDSAEAAALREAEEEIALSRDYVTLIGPAGIHLSGQGFRVRAFAGLVDPAAALCPCPREVDEIFEVPLAHIANPENRVIEERQLRGAALRLTAIPYKEYHIWGLTAGILVALTEGLWDDT